MNTTADRVRATIAEQTGLTGRIRDEDDLERDLGADSLDNIELCMAIEEEFKLEIADEEWLPCRTVGEIVRLVEARVQN